MNLYFTSKIRNCLYLFSTPVALKTCARAKYAAMTAFNSKWKYGKLIVVVCSVPRPCRPWSFHVVDLQIYIARTQLLFCSLNLLFGDVPVFVVVVCLRADSRFDIRISISISRHTQTQYDVDNKLLLLEISL